MKALGAAFALITVFVLIWLDVYLHGPLFQADARIANWLHAHLSPPLTTVMLGLTHMHAQAPVLAYSAVLILFLAWRRDFRWAIAVLLVVPTGLALNYALKLTIQRARPVWAEPLLSLPTFSFPSGHTAAAILFYGVLAACLLSRLRSPRARAAVVLTAASAVTLVAFSRLYLGVHYLTDVLAALAASGAWLILCLAAVHARLPPPAP